MCREILKHRLKNKPHGVLVIPSKMNFADSEEVGKLIKKLL